MSDAQLDELFRNAMARVCTPVAVVTTLEGTPYGTTVSAFASLSRVPPMVLVSLDRQSGLLERVSRTRRFGLNVLGADQAALALRFAKKGPDAFDDISWYEEDGCPRLKDSAVWLACRVAEFVDAGDHCLALGVISRANVTDAAPLTYHAREFGTHAPLEVFEQ